jgi:Uma2 family endonuclease
MTAEHIQPSPPAVEKPRLYRFRVDAYHRMIEADIFPPDARIELIEGELIEMPPMRGPHQVGLQYLMSVFGSLATQGRLQVQMPILLSDESEPEPDLAVLAPGTPFGLPDADQVVLVIEVAYRTRRFDLERKAPMYQNAGLLETWVVDIREKRLVVFPREGGSVVYPRGQGARITPRGVPEVTLDLDELFTALPKS